MFEVFRSTSIACLSAHSYCAMYEFMNYRWAHSAAVSARVCWQTSTICYPPLSQPGPSFALLPLTLPLFPARTCSLIGLWVRKRDMPIPFAFCQHRQVHRYRRLTFARPLPSHLLSRHFSFSPIRSSSKNQKSDHMQHITHSTLPHPTDPPVC